MRLAAILALCAAAGLTTGVSGKTAQVVQSNGDHGERLKVKDSIDFMPDFPYDGPTVVVSRDQDQEILGFGIAFTEASAIMYKALPPHEQRRLLELFWGPDGIGLTMGRVHINSCDFSPSSYSFDDVPGDFNLSHFDSNVTHDTLTMIPLIHEAQNMLRSLGKDLKLLATPWSPPAWMKQSNKMDGSTIPGLKEEAKGVWAKYISKWITAYKAKGVDIWALTPQNEPENVAKYEACVYDAQQELDFIADHLGPTMQEENPEVKIFLYDHNKDHVHLWAEALANHTAAQYTHGVAFHWYSGDSFENVEVVHKKYPQFTLLATEATFERYRWQNGTTLKDGDWLFGLGYAHDILGDLNSGAVGWIDWNIILDQNGGPNHVDNVCDAAIITDGEELFVHPQYYALGHFSKYIPPGSKRLETKVLNSHRYKGETRPYGTCDHQDGLEATSFLRPDGLITTVVLNCGREPVEFKLQDGDQALKAKVPALGIQTFLRESSVELFV